MPRTTVSKPAARRLAALLAILAALALAGCGDLGEFDEGAVARQAEQYYAEKYGANAKAVDVWEDRSYNLFGYDSLDRAFCTMDDGTAVLVDFEEGVVGDNRQQDDITAAYEQRFREELALGEKRLEGAGFTVTLMLVNGADPADGGFFEGCISAHEWHTGEGEDPEEGSFFYTRYTGDEGFFEAEAERVDLGWPLVEVEVSGPDANHPDAFPTNVPEKPAWVGPVDETCRSLLPLTGGDPTTELIVYQSGYSWRALADDSDCGMLGRLSPFGDETEAGSWLIVDWVPVGKGVYVTSDEPGVRLRAGDAVLEETDAPCTFDELETSGSLDRFEARGFSPAAFQAYHLTAAPGFFSALPADVQDKGWFDIKIAYDNNDPDAGLEGLGVTPGKLEPSLYLVEENPAAEDHEGEPSFEVAAMRSATLENGFQYSTPALHEDDPVLLVRM